MPPLWKSCVWDAGLAGQKITAVLFASMVYSSIVSKSTLNVLSVKWLGKAVSAVLDVLPGSTLWKVTVKPLIRTTVGTILIIVSLIEGLGKINLRGRGT